MNKSSILLILLVSFVLVSSRSNEFVKKVERKYNDDLLLREESLPDAFTWGNKDGINYLTKSQNQHIPQYCGSCWAFGSTSAVSDRVKIARGGNVIDLFASVQWILNCGSVAGSCHGGDHLALYKFAQGKDWPYDTANPYIACSSDSTNGFCPKVDLTCNALNTARTCGTFGEACVGLTHYPNITIDEYGSVKGADNMKSEIYKRGPIPCAVNAEPIVNYHGGIIDNTSASHETDHIISVVGWGKDATTGKQYWIIRNSWGEYWGELGYFNLVLGDNQLGIESDCAWATIGDFTVDNYPCNEDGDNCAS